MTFTLIDSWYASMLAGPWSDPRGDTLVVLGGSVLEDGIIGESTYWRCVYAVLVYREGGFRQVILSGAKVSEDMRRFLISEGVPAQIIRLEDRSTTTRENAQYTTPMLAGAGRVVLLTSDYHVFRANRCFVRAGVHVLPRPFPDARKRSSRLIRRWPVFLDEVQETAKIAYYFAHGWPEVWIYSR